MLIQCYSRCTGKGCLIDLNGDLPTRNEPLLLEKEGSTYSLVIPTLKQRHGVIELEEGENMILACPGKGNFLTETKHQSDDAKCVSESKLKTNGSEKVLEMRYASCSLPVDAVMKDTRKSCSSNGQIYEIGFEVRNEFVF